MASRLSNEHTKQTKKKKNHKKTTLSHLKTLGNDLLSSRAHVNNLPTLLSFVSASSPPQFVLEALLSLQSFFSTVIADLPSSSKTSSPDDPELIYRTWLRAKFDEFVKSLVEVALSPDSDEALKEVVLDTLMEFVKRGNGGRLNSAIYHRFIYSIVYSTAANDFLLELLVSKYFKYIDVRYFTYISLEKLSRIVEEKDTSGSNGNNENGSRASKEDLIRNIYSILSRVPALGGSVDSAQLWSASGEGEGEGEGEAEDVSAKQKGGKMKADKHKSEMSAATISKRSKLKFTKAWISFLRLPLPLDVYKEVLVTFHQAVIPYLSNPTVLCDFLTRSYDIGGVISVMALSSLFILMTQHGLEYPNFYEKLYALLVPSIFMAKHRAKFFQLLDSCLKSPLLPAYLAASFAKKLSRLSISVPPSGSLVIVALIHNLLRRHPSINCLVHREDDPDTDKKDSDNAPTSVKKLGVDPFNFEENDPKKTHALRSSLWEIDTLRHHYCPPVSRFVLSLENDLTVRAKTTEISVEDFSSGSYATIFGEEIRRRVKQVPLAFYKTAPASLFSESDFAGWTFNHEDSQAENGVGNKSETKESTEGDHASAKRQRV